MSRQLGHIRRKRNIARRQRRATVRRIDAMLALVKGGKVPVEIVGGCPKHRTPRYLVGTLIRTMQ